MEAAGIGNRRRILFYLKSNKSPQFDSSKLWAVCCTALLLYNICENGRAVRRLYFQLLQTAFVVTIIIAPDEQNRYDIDKITIHRLEIKSI